MSLVDLKLKIVIYLKTPATSPQVRQVIVNSGLQAKAENKITALALGDIQTGVPVFEWSLYVSENVGGKITVDPRLGIEVDTTRSIQQLLNALEDYYDEMKTELRVLVPAGTTIERWHPHRASGSVDEVEP